MDQKPKHNSKIVKVLKADIVGNLLRPYRQPFIFRSDHKTTVNKTKLLVYLLILGQLHVSRYIYFDHIHPRHSLTPFHSH